MKNILKHINVQISPIIDFCKQTIKTNQHYNGLLHGLRAYNKENIRPAADQIKAALKQNDCSIKSDDGCKQNNDK